MLTSRFSGTRVFALCLLALVLSISTAFASHGEGKPVKKGVLFVAFGTSVPQADKALRGLEATFEKSHPGLDVRWAFTSNIIRHKLAKQGRELDSVTTALSKMLDDGYTHVAVQSLHTIPGEEFHQKVLSVVSRFSGGPGGFRQVTVGSPMMATDADMQAVTAAVQSSIPAERKADEAVVLMGHGTHHSGNIFYPGLQWYVAQKDPNIFVGTVEGTPSLDTIVAELKDRGIKTAWLMPLMSVAGDHAQNDMAGDEDDSWKSVFKANGITPKCVLKGTAEYPEFAAIWLDHAEDAFGRLAQ